MAPISEILQLALKHFQAGEYAQAMSLCRQVLAAEPNQMDALHLLGMCCRKTEQADHEGVACFRHLTQLSPETPLFQFELGLVLRQRGELEEALAAFHRGCELRPDFQECLVNLGATLDDLMRHTEALDCYQRALKLNPNCVATHCNLGNVYQSLGQHDLAIASYHRAIELDPNCAKAHWNCAMALLRTGRFREGWEEYEWREAAGETKLDLYPQPAWDGSALAGKTIMVHAEQGVGDEILFASCYPDLLASAAHCLFVCEPRLADLYKRSFPHATIVPFRRRKDRTGAEPPQPIDYQIVAGSLPRFLRPDISNFPRRRSFLIPDARRRRLWKERFAALGPGLKIGISWRAGGKPSEQAKRATPLPLWRDLFAVPGTHWVNLQYGQAEEDLAAAQRDLGVTIHDWPDADALTDLDGLAAQIAALDLVIAVGNTTVHLAGALGVPAWALLPDAPSWRWMSDVDKVPWYSSVRLFRQAYGGSWQPVFAQVHRELCSLAGVDRQYSTTLPPQPLTASPIERIPAQVSGMQFVAKLNEQIEAAVKMHQQADFAAAERLYRDVLKHTPQHTDALHLLGVLCQQTGRHAQAIKLIGQAIALVDDFPIFHYHQAIALKEAGRVEDAIAQYRRAIELNPAQAEAHLNLGSCLQERGEFSEAVACYRHALKLKPDVAGMHFNLGTCLQKLRQLPEAKAHFQTAIELDSGFAEAYCRLGQLLQDERRHDEAIECYRRAIEVKPDGDVAYRCLGKALQEQNRHDEALFCYQQSLERRPACFESLALMGSAYQDQELFDLAAEHYIAALAMDAAHLATRLRLVTVLRHLGRLPEALAHVEQILASHPDHVAARWQRATIWLQQGDAARGWPEYDARLKLPPHSVTLCGPQPLWDGAPLAGRSLLVQSEQNLSDDLYFSTWLPELLGQAATIQLACDARLRGLFARSFPQAQLLGVAQSSAADLRIPLGSLPRCFPAANQHGARPMAHLVADPTRVAAWKSRLNRLPRGLKVGLAWRAEATNPAVVVPSNVPASEHWRPLLTTPGITWISLEAAESAGDLPAMAATWDVSMHAFEGSDLEDLAARIAALDLVICVDRFTPHLAGGLGIPAWLLLPQAWGWRWQLGRQDAPRYPKTKLFRLARPGAWQELIARLGGELGRLRGTKQADRTEHVQPARADGPHRGVHPAQSPARTVSFRLHE